MITEKELHEAIAECNGVRNPNASTCMKLASYYTILDHIEEKPAYSYSPPPDTVSIDSSSEFARLIDGRPQGEIWPVIDELMDTVQILNPRLYAGVLRRLAT